MVAYAQTGHGFDFGYLYNFTHNDTILDQYVYRPYANQSILTLTFNGCVAAVGAGISYYDRQDVYDRVLLWRLPLLALWATTTLPSFGLQTQIFTLVHLIADPIDTAWSLFYKLDLAKRTAHWAETRNEESWPFTFKSESAPVTRAGVAGGPTTEGRADTKRRDRINKALQEERTPLVRYFHDVPALIVTAYDEWGHGEEATKAMNYGFNKDRWSGVHRTTLRKKCANAAFFIASDRVSRFLPSVASSLVFLIQLFASFWKTLDTLSNTYDESNPVSAGLNRTPHNIAFGALFFWLPLVVLMTALVGGSQTSHMIPRVLEDFRRDFANSHTQLESLLAPADGDVGKYEAKAFPDISKEMYERWRSGGLPVWQAEKFADFEKPKEDRPPHRLFAWLAMVLAFSIVAIPAGCAIAVSWLTPTEGFGCRAMTQLSFLIMWIISAVIDWGLYVVNKKPTDGKKTTLIGSRYLIAYGITFAKDLIFMSGTIVTLTWSALGMFNKCECWCKWPKSSGYISFLQDDYIFQMIKRRLRLHFPLIVSSALAYQIFVFGGVWCYFWKGYRMLKQRDIESVLESQNSFWKRFWRRVKGLKPSERAAMRNRHSGSSVTAEVHVGAGATSADSFETEVLLPLGPVAYHSNFTYRTGNHVIETGQ